MHNFQSQGKPVHTYDYEVTGHVYLIPLLDVYVDPVFNCRGHFTPQEVYTLGESIKSDGLKVPLLVQPIQDVPVHERPDPCAWLFRLIAGHRRYVAIKTWTSETIAKCIIETGLTGRQAHALNFTENLQRKDLNMLEEANGLNNAWHGQDIRDIAKAIGKPKKWIKTRFDLLLLPDYVQRKAALKKAQGGLTQYEVEILAELPADEVEAVFQKIVTTRGKPNQRPVGKSHQPWRNRPRGKTEIEKMISLLYASHKWVGMSVESRGYVVSTLSWVMKGIDSTKFLEGRLDYPRDSVIVDSNDQVTGFKDDGGNEIQF